MSRQWQWQTQQLPIHSPKNTPRPSQHFWRKILNQPSRRASETPLRRELVLFGNLSTRSGIFLEQTSLAHKTSYLQTMSTNDRAAFLGRFRIGATRMDLVCPAIHVHAVMLFAFRLQRATTANGSGQKVVPPSLLVQALQMSSILGRF